MNFTTIYSGKVDWDKIIFYHEKECRMGELTENAPRAEFHHKVIKFLEHAKEALKQ